MKKTFLFLFIITFFKSFSQPANINISNTTVFGGEPFLAINPKNPNNIIIAWMALDITTAFKMTIKSKVSFDGGQTWGSTYNHPHLSSTWGSADVSMCFRKNGIVYLSYIDYRQSPDSGGVYITHSLNGGITWSTPTRAWNANTEDPTKVPLDRPWLAVDNSTTTTQGSFYMTTKPAPWIPSPNRAYLKTSADSGANWSTYRYIDTINHLIGPVIQEPMAALCVAADGALCIAYPSYLTSQSVFPKIYFAKSYNKGASFQYYDLLVNPVSVPSPNNYKLGYNLVANPNNANQLAACFISYQNGDPDVYVTSTNNGGLNWSTPVRVNDDGLSNGKAQDLAWISYSNNNKIVAVWRDKRNGAGTGFYQPSDMYSSVSTNNGASFLPNIRLSTISAAHDTILTQNGNDFSSCQLNNDTIYAAWGDVRTGKLNIYFVKTSITTGLGISPILVNKENSFLEIFPNPTDGNVSIKFIDDRIKSAEIYVYNLEGKEVFKMQLENNTQNNLINLTSLMNGVYMINCLNQNRIIQEEKIIITK